MLHDAIKKLIEILKEEDVDEIEVRRFWTTIRVARRRGREAAGRIPAEDLPGVEYAADAGSSETDIVQQVPERVAQPSQEPVSAAQSEKPVYSDNAREILSPMVGTFYRSRDPQMKPFVIEGKTVDVGDILCIIEAMKLMNEIESESKCVIRRVLAEDAQPVEFGQPLFLVESA